MTFTTFAAVDAAVAAGVDHSAAASPIYPDNRQERAAELIDLSHARLLAAMQKHGNRISDTHSRALRDLLTGLTHQALGIDTGRFAYAMPCGAGKTLGMIVWIAAAWELGIRLSVAVSASQIKALGKIKGQLIERGVPESVIGLRHSYTGDAAAGLYPDTGDDDRPIMLVSHERIHRNREHEQFCKHLGASRNLLIWDESLLASRARSLSWVSVEGAARIVFSMMHPASPLRAALARAMHDLSGEVDRQRQTKGATPRPFTLLADVDVQAAIAELQGLRCRDPLQRASAGTMRDLLKLAQLPVSVAMPGSGALNDGLIHYSPAIDPALQNIAVLDASFAVRTLAQGGGLEDCTTPAMRKCKTYEQVTVCHVPLATGRHTLMGAKHMAELARHTAAAHRAAPAGERVLIFTFKDLERRRTRGDKPCPMSALQRGLQAEGIDLELHLPEPKRRTQFLTWGNETSLNEFSDCRHVVMAGVLRRNHLDLTACMAGHRDDPGYRMKQKELKNLELSEIAHCTLQGMSRGACRTVDADSRAGAMRLTILANVKGLREALTDSLPGVQWSEAGKPDAADTRTARTAQRISAHLRGLPPACSSVSVSALKKAVRQPGQRDLGTDAFADAIDKALRALVMEGHHWHQPPGTRSLHRTAA